MGWVSALVPSPPVVTPPKPSPGLVGATTVGTVEPEVSGPSDEPDEPDEPDVEPSVLLKHPGVRESPVEFPGRSWAVGEVVIPSPEQSSRVTLDHQVAYLSMSLGVRRRSVSTTESSTVRTGLTYQRPSACTTVIASCWVAVPSTPNSSIPPVGDDGSVLGVSPEHRCRGFCAAACSWAIWACRAACSAGEMGLAGSPSWSGVGPNIWVSL